MGEALLVAAVVSSGWVAGAYLLYAHTVMPALARLGDADFVRTFAALDRAIANPVFLVGSFLGAPILSAVALVVVWKDDACVWVAAALLLHLVAVAITAGGHVPRNDSLKAAVSLPWVDPSRSRADFGERAWVRWNLVRVLASVAATTLLAVALLHA